VLCAVTIPPADLRFFEFVLLRSMWPHVYVICACPVFLSVGDPLVNCFVITKQFTSRSPTDKNTEHTQMTYTSGHILRNNTNSTNANQREE
jgi:hypothetical protein